MYFRGIISLFIALLFTALAIWCGIEGEWFFMVADTIYAVAFYFLFLLSFKRNSV